MRKILLVAGVIFGMGLSQATFADSAAKKPTQCPSVASIQAVGIKDHTQEVAEGSGIWYSSNISEKYDTQDSWTFLIGKIKADSEEEAYDKATKGLQSLQFYDGPKKGPAGRWVCRYVSTEGYVAVAANPPIMNDKAMLLNH